MELKDVTKKTVIFDTEIGVDKKHKINVSEVIVSKDTVNLIEQGCDIETLESLELPIFKYNTQITIHGVFPDTITNSVGNMYKNIIINNNKSIGIKYSAIDWNKKNTLAKAIKLTPNNEWSYLWNSTSYTIYSITHIKQDNIEYIEKLKKEFNNTKDILNSDNGTICSVSNYIGNVPYIGLVLIRRVDINAIYQQGVDLLISIFSCFKNTTELNVELERIVELEKQEAIERDIRWKLRMEEENKLGDKEFETITNKLPLVKKIQDGYFIRRFNNITRVYKIKNSKIFVYVDKSDWFTPINTRERKRLLSDDANLKLSKIIKEKGWYDISSLIKN